MKNELIYTFSLYVPVENKSCHFILYILQQFQNYLSAAQNKVEAFDFRFFIC